MDVGANKTTFADQIDWLERLIEDVKLQGAECGCPVTEGEAEEEIKMLRSIIATLTMLTPQPLPGGCMADFDEDEPEGGRGWPA